MVLVALYPTILVFIYLVKNGDKKTIIRFTVLLQNQPYSIDKKVDSKSRNMIKV